MTMDQLVGKSKLSDALPMLQTIANEHNLKLYMAKDFKIARKLLTEKFKVIYCIL